MIFFWDFPVAPEGHPTARIHRSYIRGGYVAAEDKSHSHEEKKDTHEVKH
jgi:hypothetical protein